MAARAIARRIADERGWTLGREVGWHVRFDRQLLAGHAAARRDRRHPDRASAAGSAARRLADDRHRRVSRAQPPRRSRTRARAAGLARARRPSARRDVGDDRCRAGRRRFSANCPVIDVPGRTFPLDVSAIAPASSIERAIVDALPRVGVRVAVLSAGRAGDSPRGRGARAARRASATCRCLPLHGGLDADEQDAALRPTGGRRIILATNLAETTLTVPDVTRVIDTGLHKVARYDPERAIDSLEIERISQDSADQRAGRAGRDRPGVGCAAVGRARSAASASRAGDRARRSGRGRARRHRVGRRSARRFEWFEAPPPDALDAALRLLLRRLGGIDDASDLTPLGHQLRRLPLHPRLGRILIAGARRARRRARVCAPVGAPPRAAATGATSCDLLAAVDREHDLPPHVLRVAGELASVQRRRPCPSRSHRDRRRVVPTRGARRAIRIGSRAGARRGAIASCWRRGPAPSSRARAASSTPSSLSPSMSLPAPGPTGEALIRLATGIERDWLTPTSTERVTNWTTRPAPVRAFREQRYESLILAQSPIAPGSSEAAALVSAAYVRRGPTDDDSSFYGGCGLRPSRRHSRISCGPPLRGHAGCPTWIS